MGRSPEADRAHYLAHSEEIRARVRAYYASNPDKVRVYREANRERRNAQRREWGQANADRLRLLGSRRDPEAQRQYARDQYAKDPEAHRRRSQAWREANPDKLADQQRRYREANAAKVHDKNAKRRARLKGATVESVDRRVVYDRDGGLCGICRGALPFKSMTLDHIVPLARGGAHAYDNVQSAHLSCNSRKGARAA